MMDVIRKATNRFTKGLVMDFSPENTQAEVLTHALNATLLTFNGNELSLQNDMGNARVETAFLPEGYIPVGTCEYGGIIYIVSYNPLEDKSQIGCFPSPERNISRDELGETNVSIKNSDFQGDDGTLINNSKYVLLKQSKLNPGDKFIVYSDENIYEEKLDNLLRGVDSKYESVENPILSLSIVSIEDSGKIVYLNSDLLKYPVKDYKYHILGTTFSETQESIDIDAYRNTLSSGYNVFRSKTSGKLAILAELLMIDSYSVTHSIEPRVDTNTNKVIDGCFDIIIHTEVEPVVTKSNYSTIPKLKYYYLKNSQGYIQVFDDIKNKLYSEPLFNINGNNISYNPDFGKIKLSDIYQPIVENSIDLSAPLEETGTFGFPKANTYHGRMEKYAGTPDNATYTKLSANVYHRVNVEQIKNSVTYFYSDLQASVYKYDHTSNEYKSLSYSENVKKDQTYYIKSVDYAYFDVEHNEIYKNQSLYKLTSELKIANTEDIANTLVEKYVYESSTVYRIKTAEDPISNLYEKSENSGEITFTKVDEANIKEGVVYYIATQISTLKSIGYIIPNPSEYNIIYCYDGALTYTPATINDLDLYWNTDSDIILYAQSEKNVYREATSTELVNYKQLGITLYYKDEYLKILSSSLELESGMLFVVVPMDSYIPRNMFSPSTEYNYIEGNPIPTDLCPKEGPIALYTEGGFIPDPTKLIYENIKLATIAIPPVVFVSPLADLPFKYDYTLVPCMNYGKLEHLSVTNTVDFSKLHAFNQSDFTTWKYHIDGNQLRLTFGAEVYDIYESDKVDALVLEFYDLWGFAGSIEITGKKSYSGLFTKMVTLDTLNGIDSKKVGKENYIQNYSRNINIKKDLDNRFWYGQEEVKFHSPEVGWLYVKDNTPLQDSDNDCGTLYSNLIYGVKAYLRVDKNGTKAFIKKRDLFLFTLPIYNEYYYTVNDFNTLHNPKLDLVLTHKFTDYSIKQDYNGNGYYNGYNLEHKQLISQYLDGSTGIESDLDVIKYVNYEGTTEIGLEIGLKEEYKTLNLSYDPIINTFYTCELFLTSDEVENKTYDIKYNNSTISDEKTILNYTEDQLGTTITNKLGFTTNYNNVYNINNNFDKYNFLNNNSTASIPLKYTFVVGYKTHITDMSPTEIPTTTVCALFHKQNNGRYNYEDFGLYTKETSNGEYEIFSDVMFFNEGNSTEEVFGLCRHISSDETMYNQCEKYEVKRRKAENRKLNTGAPLRELIPYLGKLTFCTPHAHGLSTGSEDGDDSNGVNIWDSLQIGRGITINEDDVSFGMVPSLSLNKNPVYNMVLNTKNMINFGDTFISTISYKTIVAKARGADQSGKVYESTNTYDMYKFTGLSGKELLKFNEALLTTMKDVYAYNPDYDYCLINIGKVTVENLPIQVTSNLLCRNAKLELPESQCFSDYLYLGSVCVSDYFNLMQNFDSGYDSLQLYTNKKLVPQISFTYNLKYCGEDTNPLLLSSLTYDIPTYTDVISELSFNKPNLILIRHEDGQLQSIEGTINKNALYGYDKNSNKLIQLDVSNYEIDNSGKLSFKNLNIDETITATLNLEDPVVLNACLSSSGYTFTVTFTGDDGNSEDVQLNAKLKLDNTNIIAGTDFYKIVQHSRKSGSAFNITASITRPKLSLNNLTYTCKVSNLSFDAEGVILDQTKITSGNGKPSNNSEYIYGLEDQDTACLKTLTNPRRGTPVTLKQNNGNEKNISNNLLWKNPNGEYITYVNGSNVSLEPTGSKIEIDIYSELTEKTSDTNYTLASIVFKEINYNITRISSIAAAKSSVILTSRTNDYSNIKNKVYTVNPDYSNSTLKYTSLTLNDLEYNYAGNHRLFVRNNLVVENTTPRNIIYYRGMNAYKTWNKDTSNFNGMHLFVGPCFVSPEN